MNGQQQSTLWQPNPLDSSMVQHHSTPQLQPSPYYKAHDNDSIISTQYSDVNRKARNGVAVTYTNLLSNAAKSSASSIPKLNPLDPYHPAQSYPNNSGHNRHLVDNYHQNPTFVSEALNENVFNSVKLESPYNICTKNDSFGVHLMAQDDNWCDNVTAVTGNTSDHSGSFTNVSRLSRRTITQDTSAPVKKDLPLGCEPWSSRTITIIFCGCVFLSPILMVLLPKCGLLEWKTKDCGPECDGMMISFVFKLLILLVGSWAVFFRRPKASLPRVDVHRSTVLAVVVVLIFSYWLFYSVRIAEKRFMDEEAVSYASIVQFSASLVDALLFVHYLTLILMEIRHLDAQYVVKVVRSPDGYSRYYTLGQLSIQRTSVWVLEKYYQDFPVYNSQLERISLRRNRRTSSSGSSGTRQQQQQQQGSNAAAMKFYDVDGLVRPVSNANGNVNDKAASVVSVNLQMNPMQLSPKSILAQNTAANAGSRANGKPAAAAVAAPDRRHDRHETASHHSAHSDHHQRRRAAEEQHEYERRIKKRRARLIAVTEDAFGQIKRIQQDCASPSVPMDPRETAQSIFPSIAKTMQKFLRLTRQHQQHSAQSILDYLAVCLQYNLSPKTFLEKFLYISPVFSHDGEAAAATPSQTWNLVCDTLVSRSIESGCMFLLRQGDISLLVTVHQLPHFTLCEDIIDPTMNKFVFKLNSETSV